MKNAQTCLMFYTIWITIRKHMFSMKKRKYDQKILLCEKTKIKAPFLELNIQLKVVLKT